MESPSRTILSLGTPLLPISPERINKAASAKPVPSIPQSPSMPEFGKPSDPFAIPGLHHSSTLPTHPLSHSQASPSIHSSPTRSRHVRNKSSITNHHPTDATVQTMIARFDNMSIKDYKISHDAALRRMEMAREMAELESGKLKEEVKERDSDARKAREEGRKLKKEVEDGKDRERKMAKRLETLMDEFQRAKETHAQTIAVYEKEVRRARKDAFKSSSGSVKLQEEVKSVKASLKALQVNYESEKMKSGKREQEAFQAQYQLVGVQEQLATTQDELASLVEMAEKARIENERLKDRCKVLEEEREGLKKSLEEEEVARIAAEGRIALPAAGDDDEFDLLLAEISPMQVTDQEKAPKEKSYKGKEREITAQSSESEKENVLPVPKKSAIQLKTLQEELGLERKLRIKAQDQVEFMKMECHFGCCSCRIAEQTGGHFVHDESFVTIHSKVASPISQSKEIVMQTDEKQQVAEIEMRDTETKLHHDDEELDVRHASTPEPAALGSIDRSDVFNAGDHSTIIHGTASRKERRSTKHVNSVIHVDDDIQAVLPELGTAEDDYVQENMQSLEPLPPTHSRPATPTAEPEYEVRTITTTTTVPMMFSPQKPSMSTTYPASTMSTPKSQYDARSLPTTPRTVSHPSQYQHMLDENEAANGGASAFKPDGTIDREAALEMIRQRRGRARSIAMGQATPGKGKVQGVVGGSMRRDVTR